MLQLSDSLTHKSALLRLQDSDGGLTTGQLLGKYLFHLDGSELQIAGAITSGSLVSLRAIQDLVYSCDDTGKLTRIFSGMAFRQRGDILELADIPRTETAHLENAEVSLIELTVDRNNVGYDRNWKGFHCRRWQNSSEFFESFVRSALEQALGGQRAEEVLNLESNEDRLDLVRSLARRIWESEFENYSRFIGDKLVFKTGDETVKNIANGAGGICAEKVQALKFLTDHYGLESEYLIGGDGADGSLPVDRLRELLRTFDFRFARRYMRYWQHTALLYHLDGIPVLVDVTNGNIPFLFLEGESADRLLADDGKESLKVRMVESEEDYYYHRVPQDIPQNLFFAMEGWLTDTDMVQVFENELGLYLSDKYYITPLPYRNDKEFERLANDYKEIAARAGFQCHIDREWSLSSILGRQFCKACPGTSQRIMEARDHLLLRYNEWDLPGHDSGLVIYNLN